MIYLLDIWVHYIVFLYAGKCPSDMHPDDTKDCKVTGIGETADVVILAETNEGFVRRLEKESIPELKGRVDKTETCNYLMMTIDIRGPVQEVKVSMNDAQSVVSVTVLVK